MKVGVSTPVTAGAGWAEGVSANPKREATLLQNRHATDAVLVHLGAAPAGDTEAMEIPAGETRRVVGSNALFFKRGAAADVPVAAFQETEELPSAF